MGQLDLQISWLAFGKTLLDTSQDAKMLRKVKKKLSEAQEVHDRYIMTEGRVNGSPFCVEVYLRFG